LPTLSVTIKDRFPSLLLADRVGQICFSPSFAWGDKAQFLAMAVFLAFLEKVKFYQKKGVFSVTISPRNDRELPFPCERTAEFSGKRRHRFFRYCCLAMLAASLVGEAGLFIWG